MKTKFTLFFLVFSGGLISNVSAVPMALTFSTLPTHNYEIFINNSLIQGADFSIQYFYNTDDVITNTEGYEAEKSITRSVQTKRIEFIYNGSRIYKYKGSVVNTYGSLVNLNIFYADEHSPIAYTEYSVGPIDLLVSGSWISGSDMVANSFESSIGTVRLHQDQNFIMTIAQVPEPCLLWLIASGFAGLVSLKNYTHVWLNGVLAAHLKF